MAKTKEAELREGTPDDGCTSKSEHHPRRGYGSEAGDVPVLFEMSINTPNEPVKDMGYLLKDGETEEDRPVAVLCEDPLGFQAGHVYYVTEEVAERWTTPRIGNQGVYVAARRLSEDEEHVVYHQERGADDEA